MTKHFYDGMIKGTLIGMILASAVSIFFLYRDVGRLNKIVKFQEIKINKLEESINNSVEAMTLRIEENALKVNGNKTNIDIIKERLEDAN